jgi:hypothetical protein
MRQFIILACLFLCGCCHCKKEKQDNTYVILGVISNIEQKYNIERMQKSSDDIFLNGRWIIQDGGANDNKKPQKTNDVR